MDDNWERKILEVKISYCLNNDGVDLLRFDNFFFLILISLVA